MDSELKGFWEKCGFNFDSGLRGAPILAPNGAIWWNEDVPLTLDNLFKYAVPLVIERGYDDEIFITKDGTNVEIIKYGDIEVKELYVGQDKDLTQALYKALQVVL